MNLPETRNFGDDMGRIDRPDQPQYLRLIGVELVYVDAFGTPESIGVVSLQYRVEGGLSPNYRGKLRLRALTNIGDRFGEIDLT